MQIKNSSKKQQTTKTKTKTNFNGIEPLIFYLFKEV